MREMKDSGVEWLGEVPAGWGVVPVKRVAVLKHGSDPKTAGDTPVYGSGQSAFKTCGEFKEGPSVLLGRKGTLNCPQYVEGRFWNVDTAFDVSMRSGDMALKYFFYAISSVDIGDLSTNTAKPSMTQGAWCSVKLPNPPIDEQRRIADFLDEKCAEVDRAVSAAEQSIEEYKTYKNSIVFQAATKGLDVDVPMKDSDVEWLGEVPAEWGFDRLGGFFSLRSEKVSDEDYTPLSVTKGGVVPQLSHVAKSDDHANRKLVCKGDFAINSRSDRRNSCGFASQDGSVSLINTICVPRGEIESRYFGYLFDSSQWSDEFYSWGHGIVADLWTTGWNDMKKILLPVPPLDEQRRIADFLDEKCAEIDRAVSAKQAIIADLKAYKQSLIYEAVTGKREV